MDQSDHKYGPRKISGRSSASYHEKAAHPQRERSNRSEKENDRKKLMSIKWNEIYNPNKKRDIKALSATPRQSSAAADKRSTERDKEQGSL
uniref:Uncharacterized protein n=1 Tax=Pristionchus pacificus TaxID=54126 RepID=A0A2A6BQJ1_PRIPA|eukprot:PDM68147.1 hypothetical protein PRIPAC_46191 [Pristionchus pacificus]